MSDFFKGEKIVILRKNYSNIVDGGNNPVPTIVEIEVDNVLVSFKTSSNDYAVDEPVKIETKIHLYFKPNIEINLNDIFVVRGLKYTQDGQFFYPTQNAFRNSNNFLKNKRKRAIATQILGEK